MITDGNTVTQKSVIFVHTPMRFILFLLHFPSLFLVSYLSNMKTYSFSTSIIELEMENNVSETIQQPAEQAVSSEGLCQCFRLEVLRWHLCFFSLGMQNPREQQIMRR